MKFRISIINYANTIPFVYGLQNSKYIVKNSEFHYHYPSQGVKDLQNDNVDISILPVVAIPHVLNARIISNFCIGAQQKVDSVLLCSHVALEKITEIRLDYQSQTSNALVQILAKDVWNISPIFLKGAPMYDSQQRDQSKVIIGDRALLDSSKYEYVYDLAEEWYKAYNLPFVFACWVANKKIPKKYIQEFNSALEFGIKNIDASIDAHSQSYSFDVKNYLKNKICYDFTEERKQAQSLFLKKCSEL